MLGSFSMSASHLVMACSGLSLCLKIGRNAARCKGRGRALGLVALLGCVALAGCKRTDEAAMRAQLDPWFALGETLGFHATRGCAAGAFALVDERIAAKLRVATSVPEALIALRARGAVALDDTRQSPDQALLQIVDMDRPLGMAMRIAALEGLACMEPGLEDAFGRALSNPRAVLVLDTTNKAVILMDADDRLLIVSMGTE